MFQNEVRRRAEESQCLRATLEQTREKGEQERRSTSMKDNKVTKTKNIL